MTTDKALQSFTKTDMDFFVRGIRCHGFFYLPTHRERPPIVIMAHGFAAEKTFGLPAYAERFANQGIAVYLFDYRGFGRSDGEPRNLVNPFCHVQDWKAAIAHIRTLSQIDNTRIALWGSSFSGGHVIVAAAKDRDISAVISQVPFVDSFSTVGRMNFKFMMQATFAGLRDVLRKLTFRVPYCVPVVGAPHTFALMNTPDAQSGFMSLVPEGSSWKNECPARVMFTLLCYRPLMYAHKVACPVLIIIAENDSLISEKAIEKTANRILRGTILRLPVGHFDVYGGDEFETLVESQIQFLKCCLQRTGDYSTHS